MTWIATETNLEGLERHFRKFLWAALAVGTATGILAAFGEWVGAVFGAAVFGIQIGAWATGQYWARSLRDAGRRRSAQKRRNG